MASPPVKKTSWLREKLSKKSSLGSTGHTATTDVQPFDLTAATRYVKTQRPSPDLKDPFENGEDDDWAVLTIEKKKGPPSTDRSAMDLNHTDGMFLQGANKNRKSSGGLRMSSPVMGRRSAGATPGTGGSIKSALKQDKKEVAPDRSPSTGSGGSGATVVRRHSGRGKLLVVDQVDQRNGSRSVSPNTTEKSSSGSRRKNKAVSPGPSSSPMDESPSAGGYQESAFAKVRDTLRIQKAKKKKKKPTTKQVMQYSVPDFGPSSSKYQDPFEAQPNFTENGEEPDATGHEFTYVNIPHNRPEYCDHCGQNAWGHHQVLKCTKCEFTCHKKCEPRVFMRCSTKVEAEGILHQDRTNESLEETIEIPDNRDFTGPPVVAGPVVIPPPVPVHPPSTNSSISTIASSSSFSSSHSSHLSSEKALLARKIRDYNRKTTPVHHMHIKPRDCNIDYVGFVRVHMCIQRPIHVSTGVTRTSWYRLMRPVKERSIDSGIDAGLETAFYLPTDTNRLVHITNVATTKELIVTLLKKFCITDNHRKFSLYEEYSGDCRRLFDEDHPLEVVLEASVAGRNSKLVLRDNLHSTIQWDAFTMPELSNFIAILQREEEIYASKLRDSFMSIKKMITVVANEKEGKSDSPTLESQSGHPLSVTHVASS